jgi:hypothetical protein
MTREEFSYKLSAELINQVKKTFYKEAYGIKDCSDDMIVGDVHDTYLIKLYVDSPYDCDYIFKTD